MIIVEGSVAGDEAWSTSKLLVIAAFLDTRAGDALDRVGEANQVGATAFKCGRLRQG